MSPSTETPQRLTHPAVEAEVEKIIESGEVGFQVAALSGGQVVINTWAGRTAAGGDDVGGETIFPVFSVSKAVVATAVHVQAVRGLVDYEAPVATYWPAFSAHGKGKITVEHVLSHRAGVPAMPIGVTPEIMCDWAAMIRLIADLQPLYPAGEPSTYLSMTFGWLLGENVRRTDPRQSPTPGMANAGLICASVCGPGCGRRASQDRASQTDVKVSALRTPMVHESSSIVAANRTHVHGPYAQPSGQDARPIVSRQENG
jgi:Beta-lactamase